MVRRRKDKIRGVGRFFSDRERRILLYLWDLVDRPPCEEAQPHAYEIAHATGLSEPTTVRGLQELLSGGLVQKKRPRISSKTRNTFVRPYTLTESGRSTCELLVGYRR